ncbi:MAG TPA: hypothetical protein VGS57_05610 [Thermoanaerobaculia bacterium]|jgi:hypothetical protein|nr:hypothetical protein [Thermoanaerobaculia bacterium]
MSLARIDEIRDTYVANNTPLSDSDTVAWATVMACIEHTFAVRDELRAFFDGLERVLTNRVDWTVNKVGEIGALASLDQSLIVQIGGGGDEPTVWSMLLAPLDDLIPEAGIISAIIGGVVALLVRDGLVVNPALAAIQSTIGEIQGAMAKSLETIEKQIGHYMEAAQCDYGKLTKMHDLLVVRDSSWANEMIAAFSEDKLRRAEIDLWKPVMNAGWKILTGFFYDGNPGNSFIPVSEYERFLAVNNTTSPTNLLYDQVVLHPREGWLAPGYWARYRVIANSDGNNLLSDKATVRLFGDLGVFKTDVFNSKDGWALSPGVGHMHYEWRWGMHMQSH